MLSVEQQQQLDEQSKANQPRVDIPEPGGRGAEWAIVVELAAATFAFFIWIAVVRQANFLAPG